MTTNRRFGAQVRPSPGRQMVLDELGFTRTTGDDWGVYLSRQGKGMEEEVVALSGRGPVVGLLGTAALVAKRNLWIALVRRYGRDGACELAPATYLLDHEPDRERLNGEHRSDDIYLLKRPGLQQRRGISLVGLQECLGTRQGVSQRIVPSVSVRGHAVHARFYLAIRATRDEPCEAWLHSNNKLVYAPVPQERGGADSVVTRGAAPIPLGGPRDVLGLGRMGEDAVAGVAKVLASTLAAFDGAFEAPPAATVAVMPFGVDLMIRPDGEVRLIEFNRRPDLTGRDPVDAAMKRRVYLDVLRLAGVVPGEPAMGRLVTMTPAHKSTRFHSLR
jgi:hypothetical protein